MKHIGNGMLAVLLLAGLLVGCGPTGSTALSSMKGFELYTWQEGGQWYFALLVGTNRLKTLEEVRSFGQTLGGPQDLEEALRELAGGQFVSWMAGAGYAYPEAETIAQVQGTCRDLGLECALVQSEP